MASSSAHAQQPPTAAVNTPVDAETQNKHITWDEQNLEYNEANRTATMTIDEPPTPYLGPLNLDDVPDGGPPSLSLDDDFALDGDAPAASGAELQPPTPAASAHEPNGAAEPSTTGATGAGAGAGAGAGVVEYETRTHSFGFDDEDDDGLDPAEREARNRDFRQKRKAHYNEAGALLKRKLEQVEDDDDDDEDEDEDS